MRSLTMSLLLTLFALTTNAQISGTKTIPTDYLSISAFVNGERVDLTSFERGMYLIRLTSEKGTSLERVMKN